MTIFTAGDKILAARGAPLEASGAGGPDANASFASPKSRPWGEQARIQRLGGPGPQFGGGPILEIYFAFSCGKMTICPNAHNCGPPQCN